MPKPREMKLLHVELEGDFAEDSLRAAWLFELRGRMAIRDVVVCRAGSDMAIRAENAAQQRVLIGEKNHSGMGLLVRMMRLIHAERPDLMILHIRMEPHWVFIAAAMLMRLPWMVIRLDEDEGIEKFYAGNIVRRRLPMLFRPDAYCGTLQAWVTGTRLAAVKKHLASV